MKTLLTAILLLAGIAHADTIDPVFLVIGQDTLTSQTFDFLFQPATDGFIDLGSMARLPRDATLLTDTHEPGLKYYCVGRECVDLFVAGYTDAQDYSNTVAMWEDGAIVQSKLPVKTSEPNVLALLLLGLFLTATLNLVYSRLNRTS